jgi:hypothetical protein
MAKSMKEILDVAKRELTELTGYKVSSVVGIKKVDTNWKTTIELLEKEGIPDRMDILGVYDVEIDAGGNFINYERVALRKRGDTTPTEIETAE